MEQWFGVIASGTAGPLQAKKKLHLANLTRALRRPQHLIFKNTEWHVQKINAKEIKKCVRLYLN